MKYEKAIKFTLFSAAVVAGELQDQFHKKVYESSGVLPVVLNLAFEYQAFNWGLYPIIDKMLKHVESKINQHLLFSEQDFNFKL